MPYAGLRTTFKAKNLAQLLRHCSFGLREATLWPSPYSPIHKEFIAQLKWGWFPNAKRLMPAQGKEFEVTAGKFRLAICDPWNAHGST